MQKLLVTLGPASLNPETIRAMTAYDPYVFRLNMSHVSLADLPAHIKLIQQHSTVPVCIDSEGAQIRTHIMRGGSTTLVEGQRVIICHELEEGTADRFALTPRNIAASFQTGDLVRLDWHGATVRITKTDSGHVEGLVERGGTVASCKAVDVDRDIAMPAITAKDREAIRIAREFGVKHFALSFAGSARDVNEFRALAGPDAVIISKIESLSALRNLGDVLTATDAALIDRGDLSRVVRLEKIPFFQMRIVSMARALDTPIYIATNLLESMIESGLPTRAELNDVVSSLLMGADGLVLAAESAVGKHPVQCVATIRTLISYCRKWTVNSSIEDIFAI